MIGVAPGGYESDVKFRNSETFCLGIASNWGMVQITPELLVGSGGSAMRKWFLPLTVLGLGGIGAALLSPRGRHFVSSLFDRGSEGPSKFIEWNETAQNELARIQKALDRIAEHLDPGHERLA
jgi:hypothetical protein